MKRWSETNSFKSLCIKESQLKFYQENNANDDILLLIKLESRSFGTAMEHMIREMFGIDKRTSSRNDGVFKGVRIEIKSARYWLNTEYDCKWQHIEVDYDYTILIFVLVGFHDIHVWGVHKRDLLPHLKLQGRQGYWVNKHDVIQYLTPLRTVEDLTALVSV